MKSKSKLLVTSTLLSQVLSPVNALANQLGYETIPSNTKIGMQLESYFNQESAKAERLFDTAAKMYLDVVYVDNKPVPHYFRMAVAIQKMARAYEPQDSDCSSTRSCSSGESYPYQFLFKRQDLTAANIAVYGDGRSCKNSQVGYDVEGRGIFQEVCSTDDSDVFYGDIVENTPEKQVYKIKRFSTTSTRDIYGIPVATLVVQKNAAGQQTASFVVTEEGEFLPTGETQKVEFNVLK